MTPTMLISTNTNRLIITDTLNEGWAVKLWSKEYNSQFQYYSTNPEYPYFSGSPEKGYGNGLFEVIPYLVSYDGEYRADLLNYDANTLYQSIKFTTTGNIITIDPVVTTVTVNYISPCTGSIAVGATCTLSATCKDQFDGVIDCGTKTWTSRDTAIATVNSSTGVVTGVSAGTARIYASSGDVNSSDKSVTVTAAPVCTQPSCTMTIV